jgi:pimeloyl-ACP methyl ester carboxylesterase
MNNDTLTPTEAAYIATNCYFALKDWINEKPVAGVESRSNIQNRVLGNASAGSGGHVSSTLSGTDLGSASLGNIHAAQTGLGVTSGFGYTLTYEGHGKRHVVIATRGTRPELGYQDLFTDLRASVTTFADYGLVHKGFKRTFDSILPHVNRDIGQIRSADIVHCVGHSLGGGVATLIAAHFAKTHPHVKLYTFGCPRVGTNSAYSAIERKIRPENVYRVAHDLDPITLIGPYPYIHLQPSPGDINFMTLTSPTGKLLSTANHDMREYIRTTEESTWQDLRNLSTQVDFDNSVLARWLLRDDNNPGWVTYASVQTLSLLFKLFNHVLKNISTSLILGLSAVDMLAEVLLKGMHRLKQLGERIYQVLKYAATWAGVKAVETADFTTEVIKAILGKMLATLRALAMRSVNEAARNITPARIAIVGAGLLTGMSAF